MFLSAAVAAAVVVAVAVSVVVAAAVAVAVLAVPAVVFAPFIRLHLTQDSARCISIFLLC